MLDRPVLRPVYLGLIYFAVAFCAGAVLGTLRTILVEPRIGALGALLLELPLILSVSWHASKAIYFRPAARLHTLHDFALSGLIAFFALQFAEVLLALLVLGRTGAEILSGWTSTAGMIGLSAQALFSAIPVLQELKLRRGSLPKQSTH